MAFFASRNGKRESDANSLPCLAVLEFRASHRTFNVRPSFSLLWVSFLHKLLTLKWIWYRSFDCRRMKTPSSAAIPDGVSGLVERVTFHNPETGFAVMRVTVKGRREPLTVVGVVASVNTGEWITAEGTWVRDREHGLQLKADSITCNAPNSREGIEKYLGSGLIKGIGPVYAKKLVDTFGEEIFAIIDQCSVRL